ncbi:MAG: 5'/3'-nucleotidase SurE [Firmicutes bacterium]|nr:5'/3'-nucleotidase SurE [Bacillota bacterium]
MRILISNDDGIQAEGIRALALALSEKNEVYVAAPSKQQSAQSHSLSVHTPLYAKEESVPGTAAAWSVNGKPADATKLGLYLMDKLGRPADLVFAGINHGGNYGWDTLYSGTVGAATEGNFCGRPAVAMSVNSHEPQHGFGKACEYACMIADKFREALEANEDPSRPIYSPKSAGIPLHFQFGELEKYRYRTLSVNVPDIPASEVKGLRIASIGPRDYTEWLGEFKDAEGRTYYEYAGKPVAAKRGELYEFDTLPEDNDTVLMTEGWATLSVINHDLTDYGRQAEAERDFCKR